MQKKPEILCKTCLGCTQLDSSVFKGVYSCSNYRTSEIPKTFIDEIVRENYWKQERLKHG